jgi:hypothetical protein
VNLTPALRCPRCMNPFKIPLDKLGMLARCKPCGCQFRVYQDPGGKFDVRGEVHPGAVETLPDGIRPLPQPQPVLPTPGGIRPVLAAVAPVGVPAVATPVAAGGRSRRKWWLVGLLALVGLGTLAALGYWLFPTKAGPVSLGKYGGIAIGSTGVKMIGLEYYRTPAGVRYRILAEPEDENPKLTNDLGKAKSDFARKNFDKTVRAVRRYFEKLHDKLGVPKANIRIVCSSGVLAKFQDDQARKRNRDRLVAEIRDRTGKTPEFLDPDQEAEFALQAMVPRRDWKKAVVVDIGGENIKGGGYDDDGAIVSFEIRRAGVKSFARLVKNRLAKRKKRDKVTFATLADRLARGEIAGLLRQELKPVLLKRQKIYFIGGIAWAMATYTNPAEFYAGAAATPPRYRSRIFPNDFEKFEQIVCTKEPREIKNALVKGVEGEGAWAGQVEKNLQKIQQVVFKDPKKLQGGAQILLAVAREFRLTIDRVELLKRPKETFGFRYGHVAWLIGYLGARSGHMK